MWWDPVDQLSLRRRILLSPGSQVNGLPPTDRSTDETACPHCAATPIQVPHLRSLPNPCVPPAEPNGAQWVSGCGRAGRGRGLRAGRFGEANRRMGCSLDPPYPRLCRDAGSAACLPCTAWAVAGRLAPWAPSWPPTAVPIPGLPPAGIWLALRSLQPIPSQVCALCPVSWGVPQGRPPVPWGPPPGCLG